MTLLNPRGKFDLYKTYNTKKPETKRANKMKSYSHYQTVWVNLDPHILVSVFKSHTY